MSQSSKNKRKSGKYSKFPDHARVALSKDFLTGDRKRSYQKGATGNVLEAPRRGFRSVEMDDAGEIFVPISYLIEA